MPMFKCTWFFDGVQENPGTTAPSMVGWTETWYGDFTTVENAVIAMRDPQLQGWLRRRAAFMPSVYQIRWVRASSVDNPRLTKTAGLQSAVQGEISRLTIPAGAIVPAQINCAALVDFVVMPTILGDRTHHRRTLLRGLPVSLINGNIFDEASQAFAAMLRFCDYIGLGRAPVANPVPFGPWQIRFRDPATNYTGMTSLQVNPLNARQLILNAPLVALPGARIVLRNVTFPRGVNRVWTVLSSGVAGAPPFTLGTNRFDLSGEWNHTGQAIVQRFAYGRAAQYLVIGLRNKKTGRPFRLTRGRQRVL